jgi:succinyl-CoA synthetase beta subunit
MNCFEYEGKSIFNECGIPVPRGKNIKECNDAGNVLNEMGLPLVIKAQVLSGKRGKAGGIKVVSSKTDFDREFSRISSMSIYGEPVKSILVEEALDIKKEMYLGVTLDPATKSAVLLFSPEGGMDIEEISRLYPEKLLKHRVDREMELFRFLELFSPFSMDNSVLIQTGKISAKLVNLFFEIDATTIEINPLVIQDNGKLIAADSKIVIDDNALFRQDRFEIQEEKEETDHLVMRAKRSDLAFVPLNEDGIIGSIAGGAGLGMATVDAIRLYNASPANFLDVGGGVSEEKMCEAVKIVTSISSVRGFLINVFGGINNCEVMANGIARALKEQPTNKKIVVKMRGHSQEEGWAILKTLSIPVVKYGTTEEAVCKLLTLIREE